MPCAKKWRPNFANVRLADLFEAFFAMKNCVAYKGRPAAMLGQGTLDLEARGSRPGICRWGSWEPWSKM